MSKLKNLSMTGKVLLLATVFASGFLVFAVVAFSTLNSIKIDGPQYNKIVADKNLMADILPPPAYIVESLLVARQFRDAQNLDEIEELTKTFSRLKSEYETSLGNWSKSLQDEELQRHFLADSQNSAREFFNIVDRDLIPAAKRFDKKEVENLITSELTNSFNAHQSAINKTVARNKEIEKADQEYATATTISRTRMLFGLAILVLGSVVGFCVWLRKGIAAQEEINADLISQITAVGRSQAVIQFDPTGKILTANENFCSATVTR